MSDAMREAEFTAMREVDDALQKVPPDVQARVLRWACGKYGVTLPPAEGGQ